MMFYFAENQNFSSAASIRCKEVVSSCNPERKMDKQSQPGGTIPLCPHKGCAFKCCDFQQMVHILLYPGEIEEAAARGRSIAHLQVIDANYRGGVRAKCCANDTATCDNGYKPLDCISYPFFPELATTPGTNGTETTTVVTLAKGSGCPIQDREIPRHESYVRELWLRLVRQNPKIAAWLRSLSLSNTDPFDPESYDPF